MRKRRDNEVRLVCFDWGGVIVEICRSWHEAFAIAGLDASRFTLDESTQRRVAPLIRAVQTGELDEHAFCAELAPQLGASTEALLAAHRCMLKREYPGVAAVVETLHAQAGLTTGLLSNTSALHFAEQEPGSNGEPPRFPTAGKLHVRVASHRVGCVKPEREIYAAFEEAAGVRGSEILFFDDLEANVTAAQSLGWRAERIDPHGDPATQLRHHLAQHHVPPFSSQRLGEA